MAIAPGLRVGRYEVLRKLGQGGFGILYVGRDTELDREVALKFLRPEHVTRPDVVMRFLQEARSAAKINHAGIVTVFECGQVTGTNTRADGTVYIAMELLAGESLAMRLKRERLLAPAIALGIVRQMCTALQAAHSAGIIHRDLKPDNIFLVPDAAMRDGIRVKILDFGVAKLADGQFGGGVRTHSAMVLGTPNYMSPEQCKSSAKVDHRSDIYAVGCILYELVCGERPYTGDAGEQIALHQLGPVPVPRNVNANVPEDLDRLIQHMLAKSPDDRPGSMEFVDEALAQCERFASPIAPPDQPLVREDPGPTSASTMFEGEHAPTKVTASERKKWPIAVGALVMAGLGVGVAIAFTGGGESVKEPPRATAATPTVSATSPDAAVAVAVVAADASPGDELKIECLKAAADRQWSELITCSDRLAALDPATAKHLRAKAELEYRAAEQSNRFVELLTLGELDRAKIVLDTIPAESVYRADAQWAYDQATKPCDADELRKQGEDKLATGDDASALESFEEAIACKPDDALTRFAFMAACRAKNADAAQRYYVKLPSATTTGILQICVRNGIDLSRPTKPAAKTVTKPKPACDWEEPLARGKKHASDGMDAAALAAFERALKCKSDASTLREAAMAACRSRNAAKAKLYLGKIGTPVPKNVAETCGRNGFGPDAEAKCDADALRQKGEDHLQTGMDAAALAAFEASMKCRPDAVLLRMAFMAACRSKNAAKAKYYYPKLPSATSTGIVAICVRNGIQLP